MSENSSVEPSSYLSKQTFFQISSMSSDSNAEVGNSSPEGDPVSPSDSTSCSSEYSTSATSPSLDAIETTPPTTAPLVRPLSSISISNHNSSILRSPFEVTPEQRSMVLHSLQARKLRESTPFANLILEC